MTKQGKGSVRKSRRQNLIRFVKVAGLGLVILDLVIYFAAYRPLENMIAAQQQQYSEARERIREEQARLERLSKFQAALPDAAKHLVDFTKQRTTPRRRGYSTVAHLVRQQADAAGVQPPSIVFRLDSIHHDPLARLGLDISTEGPFSNVMKFAHALETSSDFLLIRGFSLATTDSGALSLRLVADFYMTP